jgi:ABC-type phosphate transport system auxiliary subunit
MGEIKQANFRIDSDTADAFRAFCEQKGMNQAQGFDHVMQVFELNQAKSSIPGRSVEIEEFETMVKSITSAYLYSLELNQNAEARAREEFSSELQRKELRLTELQKKVEQLQAEKKKMDAESALLTKQEQTLTEQLESLRKRCYGFSCCFHHASSMMKTTAKTITPFFNVYICNLLLSCFVGIVFLYSNLFLKNEKRFEYYKNVRNICSV